MVGAHRHRRRELSALTGPAALGVAAERASDGSWRQEARPDGTGGAGSRTSRRYGIWPRRRLPAPITRWLRPEHFAREEQGKLYAVMRDMDAVGRAVDPVTVSWEAARHGLTARSAAAGWGVGRASGGRARNVHRHGMLAQAAQAGRAIQTDAADPPAPAPLLKSAADRLQNLRATAPVMPGARAKPGPQTGKALRAGRPSRQNARRCDDWPRKGRSA